MIWIWLSYGSKMGVIWVILVAYGWNIGGMEWTEWSFLIQWDKKISGQSRFLGVKWLFWNQNLKTIPLEYRDILYFILKVLIRPLKWGTVHLWTPTGFQNTSHKSWTFEKNLRFTPKMNVFFERSTLTAGLFTSSRSSETYCTSF